MRISEIEPQLLDKVKLTSINDFMDSLRYIPKENLQKINDNLLARRAQYEKPFADMAILYHGAPQAVRQDGKMTNPHADITANGFKLTRGRRGGAFGSNHFVDNLGIFLTDSPTLAGYFGNNRDEYERGKNIECRVDITGFLDSSTAKGDYIKHGIGLVNAYEGTKKTRLAVQDWWWLVDQKSFVDMIKQHGYTGIRFKESTGVRKSAGALDAHTYFVFDPAMIHINTKYTIRMFYEELVRENT